jgi:hypothetical protein
MLLPLILGAVGLLTATVLYFILNLMTESVRK